MSAVKVRRVRVWEERREKTKQSKKITSELKIKFAF